MRHSLFPLVIALLAGPAAADISCHIHPPGSTPERPVGLIGPFPSAKECELERARRLGGEGRCHCVGDFTPRWTPQEPALPSTDDPRNLL